ncbi:phenazine biosynthesis-like domain-containing protein isoform X2 [Protopterus annectens]|uniref:phenazine biosynthesis-like domain-containing protein isoform X2 n=1 Tax=Protopterus annectens TaxID=7888 RepID=UPI001CF99F47|nr:phenazine biosynthesis-like domain-containing protein isoform X2 [Protopterus annectens]
MNYFVKDQQKSPIRYFLQTPGLALCFTKLKIMQLFISVVDAFTDKAFHGNPAAVCLLDSELDEDIYQKIAAEMNLSETAFILKKSPTDDFSTSSRFGLRWFTPTTEVSLCGHATLASAAVLFQLKSNINSTLVFETLSGDLSARQSADQIVLNFPLCSTVHQDLQEVKDLVKAAVSDLAVQDVRYSSDTQKLLIRLSDFYQRSDLENLKVNPQTLLMAEKSGRVKGVIVTLKGSNSETTTSFDFYSRYFGPWWGIAEDPVTGECLNYGLWLNLLTSIL